MKKLLLSLLLGMAALTPSVNANISLTIVSQTPERLVLDLFWGPAEDLGQIPSNEPTGAGVSAEVCGGAVIATTPDGSHLSLGVFSIWDIDGCGGLVPTDIGSIIFVTDGWGGPLLSWSISNGPNALVTPRPDGYGLRIIYGNFATELLNNLIAEVNGLSGVKSATKNALVVKLNAALKALSIDDTATACARMRDFINLCLAQKSKKLIPASVADDLIADATQIRDAIGCP